MDITDHYQTLLTHATTPGNATGLPGAAHGATHPGIDATADDTGPRRDEDAPADPLALRLGEYTDFLEEIEEQPLWRSIADREMDYADGNQLNSDLLRKMAELGIPPAVENLIGPALLAIQGYEATVRTDWRVSSANAGNEQDVADAINARLNEAERESGADRAMSEAFRPQAGCGVGVLEVSRNSDPFGYPYRCLAVHRSEIYWDWKSREADMSDARWLIRQRWLAAERIAMVFPESRELIDTIGRHGPGWWGDVSFTLDGGTSTGLKDAWETARGWTIQEDRWYNPTSRELCLCEVWYRRWTPATLIKAPDGRLVEYDEHNPAHAMAVAQGLVQISKAIVARVRRSYWLGPHCLHDGPTPYTHRHFPYVIFWGFREDTTRVPFGYIRDMVYSQDSLNSGISKLRWGMSVVRVERTKGAVAMSDEQLRRQISRANADIVLDAQHMAQPGARFDVNRDYTLTEQHFKMLEDNRSAIQRTSAVSAAFSGQGGNAQSGFQEQIQVEQTNQSLATMMDNFRAGRRQVGELLMAMILQDMGEKPASVTIPGDAVKPDRSVALNQPALDELGQRFLTNDLQRTRLKVALDDVPSTNSYRGQQLNAMSEAVKSLPPNIQAAVLPYLVSLMDVPFKKEVVQAIRSAGQQPTQDQIQQQINQAVQSALSQSSHDLKSRELDLKEQEIQAQIKLANAKAVESGVQAAYGAMQGGVQVASMPQIAPIADNIMQGAGYQSPGAAADNPNFQTPAGGSAQPQSPQAAQPGSDQPVPQNAGIPGTPVPQVRQNPHPLYPPVPGGADAGMGDAEGR